jgi:SAM-dependent methyltransferase
VSAPPPDGAPASPCPVCASSKTAAFESYDDPVGGKSYVIYECADCALVFARPLLFPGAAWYGKYNYVCGYAETAAGAAKLRFPYFLDRLPEPGRILDVGCAGGAFLTLAAERGFTAEGLDVDARFVKMAHDAGLAGVRQGVLDQDFARANAGRYAAVAIVDDPLDFLRLFGLLLKPGGRLLVSVPDNRRPTPFGRDLWDYPPHHLTRWGPKSLRLALEKSGFAVEDMRSTPLPVVDFSRIWADRSAQWILRALKRVLYGRDAAARPMDEILDSEASAGRATALPEKTARVRLVFFYHAVFNFLTYPLFAVVLLYYRLTKPDTGHTLLAVARKAD